MFRLTLKYLMSSWICWSRTVIRLLREGGVLRSQCHLPRFYSPREHGLLSEFYALVKYKSQLLNRLNSFWMMRLRLWDSLITTLQQKLKSGGSMGQNFYSTGLALLRSIRLKVSKVLIVFGLKRRRLSLLIRLKYLSLRYGKRGRSYGSVGTRETQRTRSINCSTVRSPHLIRFTRK